MGSVGIDVQSSSSSVTAKTSNGIEGACEQTFRITFLVTKRRMTGLCWTKRSPCSQFYKLRIRPKGNEAPNLAYYTLAIENKILLLELDLWRDSGIGKHEESV